LSRDRDRILEQALKHELRAAGALPGDDCLDAETLAAWTDGGLDANGIAAAEAHVSNCARCQSLAATFASGTLSTSSTQGTLDTQGASGTFPLWKWWLAPIAAGVTAVTLWMVIPENDLHRMASVAPVQEKESRAAAEAVDAAAPAPSVAAEPPARADADRFASRDSAALERQNRSQPAVVAEQKKEAASALQESVTLADAAAGAAVSEARRAEAASSPPPPPSPRSPAPPMPVTVPPMPAAAPPPAIVALEAGSQIAGLQKSAKATSYAIEVPSIQPSRKWRIAGNRIERTDDGGTTWTVQREIANEAIAAGSAPAAAVAWFVGNGGLVLVTADSGATFTDVSLAEPLDLASVSATDARNASIFTVSGRRFRTQDGGRTWQPF
jgi:hypothetical protein